MYNRKRQITPHPQQKEKPPEWTDRDSDQNPLSHSVRTSGFPSSWGWMHLHSPPSHLLHSLILDHPSSSPVARMTPSPSPSPSPSTTSSTRLNPFAAPWMKRATDSPVLRPCSSTTNSSIRNATAGLDVQRVDLVDTRSGAALLSPPKHPLLLLALLLLLIRPCASPSSPPSLRFSFFSSAGAG
jgi:hypothetical protein